MAQRSAREDPEEGEYVLGTDRLEIERLRFQHVAWIQEAYGLWERAGVCAGQTVVDLGCGPGFTSFELARLVGPEGKVFARDESARFLEFLRAEAERHGIRNVEPSLGPVEELDLPPESVDVAYARWLLCWLDDPGAAVERIAPALRPGGVLALQEYFDWGAMKLVPPSPDFDRSIAACMRSWETAGVTIDVGDRIPSFAQRAGLAVESVRPLARIGRVGSLEWRWLGDFLESYLPKLVERDLFTEAELQAHRRAWRARADAREGYVYAPVMVDVVLRKR